MLIQLIIDTDDNSVIILTSKSDVPKSREVKETIDKELVKKVKKLLPKLASKLRDIINDEKNSNAGRTME